MKISLLTNLIEEVLPTGGESLQRYKETLFSMQRESTIKFWDDFYVAQEQEHSKQQQQQQQQGEDDGPTRISSNNNNLCKEWILQPSPALLGQLANRIQSVVSLKRHCTSDQQPDANTTIVHILEIGSGTSCLARELCLYLNNNNIKYTRLESDQEDNKTRNNQFSAVEFHVLATDVSHVCIEQNRQRDAHFMSSSSLPSQDDSTVGKNNNDCSVSNQQQDATAATSSFPVSLLQYQVLNVVQGHSSEEFKGMFDVILDKGCLDTFLFRSRNRGSGRDYSPLIRTVLDNIHTWLKATAPAPPGYHDDDNDDKNDSITRSEHSNDTSPQSCSSSSTAGGGVYLVLSPRSKLKCVRDYKGFSSVVRHLLDLTQLDRGDLENSHRSSRSSQQQDGKNSNCNNKKEERIYLYQCHKNSTYSPATTKDNHENNSLAASCTAFSMNGTTTGDNIMTTNATATTTTTKCPKCEMNLVDFFKGKTRGNKIAWTRKFQGHIQHCKGMMNDE